jgi:hypothetical protein
MFGGVKNLKTRQSVPIIIIITIIIIYRLTANVILLGGKRHITQITHNK